VFTDVFLKFVLIDAFNCSYWAVFNEFGDIERALNKQWHFGCLDIFDRLIDELAVKG